MPTPEAAVGRPLPERELQAVGLAGRLLPGSRDGASSPEPTAGGRGFQSEPRLFSRFPLLLHNDPQLAQGAGAGGAKCRRGAGGGTGGGTAVRSGPRVVPTAGGHRCGSRTVCAEGRRKGPTQALLVLGHSPGPAFRQRSRDTLCPPEHLGMFSAVTADATPPRFWVCGTEPGFSASPGKRGVRAGGLSAGLGR